MKFNRPARVPLRCGCLALALMPADGPRAEKLPLDFYGIDPHGDDETVTTSGGLTWRGGLRISSDDPRFGGLSAFRVEQDGRRLVALTDKGRWITARLSYDEAGHLDGISDGEIGPLRSPDGKSVAGTEDGDSESPARYHGGTVVAFEGPHRLWSYNGPPPAFSRLPTRLPRLPTLTRAHRNRGIEALTTLSDGRLFALAEDLPTASGDLHGWVTDQGVWRSLTYARTGQFLPTGAATLPGGGVLVLERCFTWAGGFATRILRIGAAAIQPGRRLDGNELVELSPPLVSDNFEGISVRRGKNSAMLIYLISDDNFNILQQSLLVMFALTP